MHQKWMGFVIALRVADEVGVCSFDLKVKDCNAFGVFGAVGGGEGLLTLPDCWGD